MPIIPRIFPAVAYPFPADDESPLPISFNSIEPSIQAIGAIIPQQVRPKIPSTNEVTARPLAFLLAIPAENGGEVDSGGGGGIGVIGGIVPPSGAVGI